jgi:hypothetical protein
VPRCGLYESRERRFAAMSVNGIAWCPALFIFPSCRAAGEEEQRSRWRMEHPLHQEILGHIA